MCGGTIEFEKGATVGVCDSCGTKQTLPRLDDDRRANLYDRANHFRRNNDYDKAMSIYEQILNEDNTDAEAYWSIVLCRYGIEYVEDPSSRKRIPTVNRVQFTSIYMDEDYKSALRYADSFQKEIFEQEAKAIDEIQKKFLEISSKEDPFDVFICYKETDDHGKRTRDSALANDLYHQLTQEGFKVFFSRITLEDKLGTAYEPCIFAALNSAKVMVVLGTRPEYFNAVWVKNEWSRFLALVKASKGKKVLIPAYSGMDPYDLPEEFSHLQAQDMSKIGFMQDLLRGIRKLVGSSATVESARSAADSNMSVGASVSKLIKRTKLFLEDGEWDNAREYCEKMLDLEPENAEVYLLKLLAEKRVHKEEDLLKLEEKISDSADFQKAVRFSAPSRAAIIKNYDEVTRKNYVYHVAMMNMARNTTGGYLAAEKEFRSIPGWKDADRMASDCEEKRKNLIYSEGMLAFSKKDYMAAIVQFKMIPGWRDADEQIENCFASQKNDIYIDGVDAMTFDEDYLKAIEFFSQIPGWKDADKLIEDCKRYYKDDIYEKAIIVMNEASKQGQASKDASVEHEATKEETVFQECLQEVGKAEEKDPVLLKCWGYKSAITILNTIPDWRNSSEKTDECYQLIYEEATCAIKNYKRKSILKHRLDACSQVVAILEVCSHWKDSDRLLNEYQKTKEKLDAKYQKQIKRDERHRRMGEVLGGILIVVFVLYLLGVLFNGLVINVLLFGEHPAGPGIQTHILGIGLEMVLGFVVLISLIMIPKILWKKERPVASYLVPFAIVTVFTLIIGWMASKSFVGGLDVVWRSLIYNNPIWAN